MISLFSTYYQDNPLEDFKLSAALLYGNILIQKWTNSKSKNKIRFMFEDGNLRTSQSRIPQGPSLSTNILFFELNSYIDVGDKMWGWQFEDVGDKFGKFG